MCKVLHEKQKLLWARDLAQRFHRLPGKREDPSSIPVTKIKQTNKNYCDLIPLYISKFISPLDLHTHQLSDLFSLILCSFYAFITAFGHFSTSKHTVLLSLAFFILKTQIRYMSLRIKIGGKIRQSFQNTANILFL